MAKEKNGSWFKRHKILSVFGAIILLIIIIAVANGGSTPTNQNSTTDKSSSKQDTTTQLAKIGQPVRDGKFEFTVEKMDCGATSVGTQYLNKKAQGQYCRLHMKVKNIGNEAQTLDDSAQYVFNSKNQKYVADGTADIYASSDDNGNSTWYNDINPGNSVEGDIYFDVPKDVTPVTAELHDSSFSGGVKVDLQD